MNKKTNYSTSDNDDRLFSEDIDIKNLLDSEQLLHPNTKIVIDTMRVFVDEQWKK